MWLFQAISSFLPRYSVAVSERRPIECLEPKRVVLLKMMLILITVTVIIAAGTFRGLRVSWPATGLSVQQLRPASWDPRGHPAQVHFISGKTKAQKSELGSPAGAYTSQVLAPGHWGASQNKAYCHLHPWASRTHQGFSAVAPASTDPHSLPWGPAVPLLDVWVSVSTQPGHLEGTVLSLAGHHPT